MRTLATFTETRANGLPREQVLALYAAAVARPRHARLRAWKRHGGGREGSRGVSRRPASRRQGVKLALCPIDLDEANALVLRLHRHHAPVVGHKFSLGAVKDGVVVGAVIVSRPVSRMRDDGLTLEITRCVTDGTRNACSFLYGAAARAAFALGYRRIGTYTLPEEGGASLRGAGWKLIGERGGGSWSRDERPRVDKHPMQGKLLWELEAHPGDKEER